MSDITCARCGESWDDYEVFHGFEANKQATFLAGDGCPHCEGKPAAAPDANHVQAWAESLLEATDDPDTLLEGILNRLNKD